MSKTVKTESKTAIDQLKEKYGVLALIDCLGMRHASNEKIMDYVKVANSIHERIAFFIDRLENKTKHPSTPINFQPVTNFKTKLFGDSILCLYEISSDETAQLDAFVSILVLSHALQDTIIGFLNEGILSRGALSLGHYFDDKNIVLGKAISDAADWFEKLNSIGIMMTPATRLFLTGVYQGIKTKHPDIPIDELYKTILAENEMPIKGKTTCEEMKVMQVNWPMGAFERFENDAVKTEAWFYQKLHAAGGVPYGIHSKYLNTEAYFKEALTSFTPH